MKILCSYNVLMVDGWWLMVYV